MSVGSSMSRFVVMVVAGCHQHPFVVSDSIRRAPSTPTAKRATRPGDRRRADGSGHGRFGAACHDKPLREFGTADARRTAPQEVGGFSGGDARTPTEKACGACSTGGSTPFVVRGSDTCAEDGPVVGCPSSQMGGYASTETPSEE